MICNKYAHCKEDSNMAQYSSWLTVSIGHAVNRGFMVWRKGVDDHFQRPNPWQGHIV